MSNVVFWRNQLKQQQAQIKADFLERGNVARMLHQHAKVVDQSLIEIWHGSLIDTRVCLIAVGGYGRGELFPSSDVDLLILLPEHSEIQTLSSIEQLVGVFWDIGLAVGHSVRTLSECIQHAGEDVSTLTNLLEARLLAGDLALFQHFQHAISQALNPASFFDLKIAEQRQRHQRFYTSAYNLEPNIKESPGGLRDIHTIFWIAASLGLGTHWNDMVSKDLISPDELRHIKRHEHHLKGLRIHLHYLAGRREDRLLFDFQNEMAAELGYQSSGHKRASEQLMHSYYRSAKYISLMNEMLLQLLKALAQPRAAETRTINARFLVQDGALALQSPQLLKEKPETIFEAFMLLGEPDAPSTISPTLIGNLHRARKQINLNFRRTVIHKQMFLSILQRPHVIENLSRMNRYGLLGQYLPAFGRIVGQMQHDLFHEYTVDEHILNVVGNLYRFTLPEHAHEFPLCSRLMWNFNAPYLLYLAALFHDIAKGRGGDHSTLGKKDAARFCRDHGLQKTDRDLVIWLVESHLLMSSTAQKSDLSDPLVVRQFAERVKTERNLVALYLLTVADIRGTSPKVWNAWKARLLENLFIATRRLLGGSALDMEEQIAMRKNKAITVLSHYGLAESSYQALWQHLGQAYFMRHHSQEIAWHSRLLITHVHTQQAIVRARLSPDGDGIQIMIYTRDRDDLFTGICSFFEGMQYNILEAKVHTTQDNYVLNSFLVADQSDNSVKYRDLLSYIEYQLAQQLDSGSLSDTSQTGRLSRQVRHMPIQTEIQIYPEKNTNQHLLEIVAGDRPGLLLLIARTLFDLNIHLQTARINTLGKRAQDTFLICGKQHSALSRVQIAQLLEQLNSKLS